jgi:hypothetical protein
MYSRENSHVALATALCLTALSGSAAAATITTFAVPGASDTHAMDINATGSITGYYFDSAGEHGFVRAPDGTITTFNYMQNGSEAAVNNRRGTIGGSWNDGAQLHVLLRTVHGNLRTFDPQGSVQTEPFGINRTGTISGTYYESIYVVHGFVRAVDGTITSFDPTGSTRTYGDQTLTPSVSTMAVRSRALTTMARSVAASCAPQTARSPASTGGERSTPSRKP